MDRYQKYLTRALNQLWLEPYWSVRKWSFLTRWFIYYGMFQWHFRFGYEFKFWLPGLEMKFACEAAEKVGADLQFLGAELNPVTYERLYHETRMTILNHLMKKA
jgi:hypothetical protein